VVLFFLKKALKKKKKEKKKKKNVEIEDQSGQQKKTNVTEYTPASSG